MDEVIALADLGEVRDRRATVCSPAVRRSVCHLRLRYDQPAGGRVFLDEPTTGLDPQARANLWDVIGRLRDAGTTLLLTTHSMEEAERLCDRVAIIDHGRVVATNRPAR
ncbi:MAG: AAA family ATPase [Dehalococcoidia bacterium]